MTIRTRVAPSPTGDPHLGTAYIALFNYCFAKQQNGEFLLRIEDTDKARSTQESEHSIINSLQWLGINWDNNSQIYRQSDRIDIYQKMAHKLVEEGKAFYCFATEQELNEMRQEQLAKNLHPKYDGRGLNLTESQIKQYLKEGKQYVIRMKIPTEGTFVFNDYLRGDIEIPWQNIDMQVLLKKDGYPTYFLANVVDDYNMGITHVFRGEEWINSAPKLLKLYDYFGWNPPVLGHLPLLRNPDKSKLSKRKNPTSINYYKEMGFIPEALLNYLGRMGWSMPNGNEKFSLSEMVSNFDMNRVSLGAPIFDVEKLKWLNGLWIRENLSDQELMNRIFDWKYNANLINKLIPHVKGRINTFSDFIEFASYFVSNNPQYDNSLLIGDKEEEVVRQYLQILIWELDNLRTWTKNDIFSVIKLVADYHKIKVKDFLLPIFVAITGKTSSISVIDAMEILGSDISRSRLRVALNQIGISKKQSKKIEKIYNNYKTT